jgi:methylphosphotriester-DNA--protein-cysteine methyltransferase
VRQDVVKHVVGVTPFDYLTDWRIGITQTLLRKGEPLKLIAPAVGYTNATALMAGFVEIAERKEFFGWGGRI